MTRKGKSRLLAQIDQLEEQREALALQLIASRRTPEINAADEAGAAAAGISVEDFRLNRIAAARKVLSRRIAMLRQAVQP